MICVPSTVLAQEGLVFDPPLPDKQSAADALPLGHVDKAFLRLQSPDSFEIDARVYGRLDTADTASYALRPMGMPVVEAFFGGDLAQQLEAEDQGAFCDFAISELVGVFGADLRRRLTPLGESRWGRDPFARGAYSHARPGNAGMRGILRAPVADRLFFAGEAVSPHAFSTAHGAFETGVEAGEAVLRVIRPSQGAGL